MVVCKFFLQGNCKFGDYCKYEHQINENYNPYQTQQSTSILRKSNFGSTQIQKPNVPVVQEKATNVDTSTLVKSVVNDMTSVEKGGQWLLSCYAPFKEKPEFPGFEDQSFEEVRFGYYEAANNGTIQQYTEQIQYMLQQAASKIKTLQNPSPDIVNMLRSIYNSPPSSHYGILSGNKTATFTQTSSNVNQQTPAIFAQTNTNVFGNGNQQQQSSIGSGNIFNGLIDSNSKVLNSNSIFPVGVEQTPFIQQTGVFAPHPGTNFAPQLPATSMPIFPNSQTLAAAPNQTSNAMFVAPTNNLGNFNIPNSSIFAQASGLPQSSNSVLKQQNVNLETQAHSANIFGGIQNRSQPIDESLYSKREDLTEEDIKFFEGDDWDITKIPEKPPMYQMCFKTS